MKYTYLMPGPNGLPTEVDAIDVQTTECGALAFFEEKRMGPFIIVAPGQWMWVKREKPVDP